MIEIAKAAFKMASGTFLGLLLGAIAIKILALLAGPSGMGIVSIVRQLHQSLQLICGLNAQNAIVQGLSCRNDTQKQDYIATVLRILGGWTIAFSLLLCILSPVLARHIFPEAGTQGVLLIYAMIVPAIIAAASSFLAGLINAHRGIGILAKAPILAGIGWVVLAYPVGIFLNRGNILMVAAIFSITSTITFVYYALKCWKSGWLENVWKSFKQTYDKPAAQQFLSFALSGLLVGVISTQTLLALRIMISHEIGLDAAGYFDAAWTLSMMYVTLLLSSFSTYYLPTLSAQPDKKDISELMSNILRFGMMVGVPMIVAIITLKPLIISVLYSKEFLPAIPIMNWMLIGDLLKIISYSFGMSVLAFPNMRAYILSELAWYLILFASAYYIIKKTGSIDLIGSAFLLCYAMSVCFFFLYTRNVHNFKIKRDTIYTTSCGFILVVFASLLTWNDQNLHSLKAILLIFVALGYSCYTLTPHERQMTIGRVRKLFQM